MNHSYTLKAFPNRPVFVCDSCGAWADFAPRVKHFPHCQGVLKEEPRILTPEDVKREKARLASKVNKGVCRICGHAFDKQIPVVPHCPVDEALLIYIGKGNKYGREVWSKYKCPQCYRLILIQEEGYA